MTFLEACATGMPFLVTNRTTGELWTAQAVNGELYWLEHREDLSHDPGPSMFPLNEWALSSVIGPVVDWFESSSESPATLVIPTLNQTKTCTCDWIRVQQVGCKCGAIVPYVQRFE